MPVSSPPSPPAPDVLPAPLPASPPASLSTSLPPAWDTAAAALFACARALGDERDLGTLAAASGLAFRCCVDPRITPAGPQAWPWREELTVAAERLGYRWRLVASTAGEPLFFASQHEAFSLAVEGAEAGRPTLLFGVHTTEFGVARGGDREAGVLFVSGCLDGTGASDRLPRDAIGGDVGLVFALQLVERVACDAKVAALAALKSAVDHARGRAPLVGGVASGLSGWAAIASAIESGRVDPAGLAYTTQRLAEARQFAARFVDGARGHMAADPEAAEAAASSYRRLAGMLAELARLLPFPPPPTEMLTTTLREQAFELVSEAARAEEQGISALERALAAEATSAAERDLRVTDLDAANLSELFACVAEIPIAGLARDAADCRAHVAPTVGAGFRGKLLYRKGRLIGHVLYAPLDDARYPVAADGKRWFLFCPWLDGASRGRKLGARLFAALTDAARAEGVDGILTVATSIEVFLHHHGLERFGFVELERRGDSRLLELSLTGAASRARFVDPPPAFAEPRRPGTLPVVVRHAYNCPLLLRVRRGAASAGAPFGARVTVDEADARAGEPAGVVIGGRPIAHAPVPPEAIAGGIAEELGLPRSRA